MIVKLIYLKLKSGSLILTFALNARGENQKKLKPVHKHTFLLKYWGKLI